MIRRLLLSWLILAVALALTVLIVPGLGIHWSPGTYLIIAAVFGVVNAFLGTILRILSFPLLVITLGIFGIVINMAMLYVTSWLTSLSIDGVGAAFFGALVLAIIDVVLHEVLIRPMEDGRKARRH